MEESQTILEVPHLRHLLAKRDHELFLAAFERAAIPQDDFLQALGGEGLYLLLAESDAPDGALAGRYAKLLTDRAIVAPPAIIFRLAAVLNSTVLAEWASCCRRRKSVEIWRHKTAAEFGVDRLTHKGPGGPLVIYGRWGQKGGSFSGGSLRVMRSSRYRSSKAIS